MPASRTRPSVPVPLVLLVLAGLALCALSAAIQTSPHRYAAVDAPAGFESVAQIGRWHPSRSGASVRGEAPQVARLEAEGAERLVYLYLNLPGAGTAEHLRISAELRGGGLAGGHIAGGAGQLVALPLGENSRRVPHWPNGVAGLDGSRDWHRVSLVMPTAGRVQALQIVAFVAAESGWMELREPRLEAVQEQPVFVLARHLVTVAWALFALAVLWWLLRPGPRRLERAALAAAGCLALFAALAPPPVVEGSAKRLLVGGQDLLYDAVALLRAPAPAAGRQDESTATARAEPGGAEGADGAAPAAGEDAGDGAAATDERDGAAVAAQEPREAAPRQYWMPGPRNLDKKSHLAGFAALALLAAVAFRTGPLWRLLPALGLLALSIEVLQGFTVMRDPSLLDLAADLAGGALGVLAAWLALRVAARWRTLRTTGL